MRQLTLYNNLLNAREVSKLPMRQLTFPFKLHGVVEHF